MIMEHHRTLVGLGLLAIGLFVAVGLSTAAQEKKAHDPHAAHFEQCAKACTDCMRECEACARHCADLTASGKKEHRHTLGTCADCAEFCAAAAKIVSRQGPMASTICESCAKACDI